MISGLETPCNFNMLVEYIKSLGVKIEAGVDWGYTNEFSITVAAIMPGGQSFIIYNFAASGFELDDCVKVALEIQERFGVQKWWCDQAYPAYLKTFNRKGLRSPEFVKDVPLGIESVRSRILDSNNSNWMFILQTPENKRLIDGFGTYHWKLDAKDEPTDHPDHTEESDIMDGIRYLYQNLYGNRSKIYTTTAGGSQTHQPTVNSEIMRAKVKELAIIDKPIVTNNVKKRIFWI
jgi:hypothetical protein